MITNSKNSHYLAETNLSGLLKGISSNLNCFNSYKSKNKLKEHQEICHNNDSCRIDMPSWAENKI